MWTKEPQTNAIEVINKKITNIFFVIAF
jgi:hypothetical protein